MAYFGGMALFSSGPSSFEVGGWSVATRRDGFPGLDGVRQLVLGARGRKIRQRGYLTGSTAVALAAQTALIGAYQKSAEPHTLIDNSGLTYPNSVLSTFRCGPVRRAASGYLVRYEAEYLQLAS